MKVVPVNDIEKIIKKVMLLHPRTTFRKEQVKYLLETIIEKYSIEMQRQHPVGVNEII